MKHAFYYPSPSKRRQSYLKLNLSCFDLDSVLLNFLQMSWPPIINYTDLIKLISLTPQK